MLQDHATALGFQSMLSTICLTPEQRKSNYERFLEQKGHAATQTGFAPTFMADALFDFQQSLVDFAVWKGRAALFADCGLGKTLVQLTWAQNVVEHTNKPVLILTPLAVTFQTILEAQKFGIDAERSTAGKFSTKPNIVVTNYEQLQHYTPGDFSGVVCDESSCLKNFDAVIQRAVSEFTREHRFRLLCTATPSPNDHMELGTSAEVLGVMRRVEMLSQFFTHDGGETSTWRLKKHAAASVFWQWVSSWARACRNPADLGFDGSAFVLPRLIERQHMVSAVTPPDGMLFSLPAVGLTEQREERRRTIQERCERVAALVSTDKPALAWCHLNAEADLIEEMVPDAKQVSGTQSTEEKEELFLAFVTGQLRCLVTKPVIGAWGLNLQNCAHMVFFPSHSWEQYYQAVRRCYRFGQKQDVVVDIVTSTGEQSVLKNLQRKAKQADHQFSQLIKAMGESYRRPLSPRPTQQDMRIPSWL